MPVKNNYTVLIVEDNQDIACQLGDFLSDKGFTVDYAANGKMAIQLVDSVRFDVIVLDLMLPDSDGLNICQHIKNTADINIPVLMLTARDSLDEKLQGFGAGADDYLTKPFAMEEVYVRCLALVKRTQLHKANTLTLGDLSIDFQQRSVVRNGIAISLSSTDFELLKLLAEAYPNPVSKRHLGERIWGEDLPETDTVRSHIYTLRNALDKPFDYPVIKTVHGIGFKLEAQDD